MTKKFLDWGQPSLPHPPWQMSKSKPKKCLKQFGFRLDPLAYNTQSMTITLTPSFQVPKVGTEWSTDLNRKVVEGLVEGSNEVVEACDLVKLRRQKTKPPV